MTFNDINKHFAGQQVRNQRSDPERKAQAELAAARAALEAAGIRLNDGETVAEGINNLVAGYETRESVRRLKEEMGV